MRQLTFAAIVALGAAAACSRTDDGKIVVERPGDVQVTTTKDTVSLPTVGTVKDTINTPTIGVKEETLIVKKPVVGTKKTEVTRPTVRRP
jgi:electron transfer flavoprotein alpha/beta subunit